MTTLAQQLPKVIQRSRGVVIESTEATNVITVGIRPIHCTTSIHRMLPAHAPHAACTAMKRATGSTSINFRNDAVEDSSKGARPKKPTPDLQAVVILHINCHAKYVPAPSQSIAGRSILPDADLAVTANSYTESTRGRKSDRVKRLL